MKEELIKNIAGVVEYIKQGADFVKEQAPLFIQEYLTFKTYLLLFWETILLAVVVGGVLFGIKSIKKSKDAEDYSDEDFYITASIISIGIAIACFIGLICCSEELVKVIFAPRVFLVDHLLK